MENFRPNLLNLENVCICWHVRDIYTELQLKSFSPNKTVDAETADLLTKRIYPSENSIFENET